ncbi:hypothetical protein F4677DRAFT_346223 [Hypoxylon crocopeplum]|nr:hypothetical protein F4677DRAFT_346223 [Hypoxylon crocopeplum]
MSYMSRNSSTTSLMGFSVHQPALGSPLQFFPAMGSKQLDDMIDTYVPGNASIAEKRATVSLEFFEYTMATGELFKFFMVYPSLGSTTTSPTGSMLDSGYVSNFTSPVMSESQWTQAGHASSSSSKKTAPSTDFSHLPGMKIMTRDGRDVTNSASRGCKTKEQRDHAHLMRIIKACDACRRKKVRCDPSHKRSTGSSAKATKKAKKTAAISAPPSVPSQSALEPSLFDSPFDLMNASSFDSAMPESLIDPTMDWSQFVQYDEDPAEAIPYDYDFFFDPAGHLSPVSSNSNSLSSSSQPITPAQTLGVENTIVGTTEGEAQGPLPPYLNPGGEAGNNYADFNLYSPGSSIGLDDDPSLSKEVAAVSRPEFSEYHNYQLARNGHRRITFAGQDLNLDAQQAVSTDGERRMLLAWPEQTRSPTSADTSSYYDSLSHSPALAPDTTFGDRGRTDQVGEWCDPDHHSVPSPSSPATMSGRQSKFPIALLGGLDVLPTQPSTSSSRLQEFIPEVSSPSTSIRNDKSAVPKQQSRQNAVSKTAIGNSPTINTSTSLVTGGTAKMGSFSTTLSPHNRVYLSSSSTRSKPNIPDDKSTSRSTSRTSRAGDTASSSATSSRTTELVEIPVNTKVARNAVTRTTRSVGGQSTAFAAKLDVQNILGRSFRATDTSHSALQNIAPTSVAMDVPKTSLLCGLALSSSLLATSESLVPLALFSVLATAALCVSPYLLSFRPTYRENSPAKYSSFSSGAQAMAQRESEFGGYSRLKAAVLAVCVLALVAFKDAAPITLYQLRILGDKAEQLETVPAIVGSLSIAAVLIALRHRTSPRVAMLDLPTRPLSFSITVTKEVKSRYTQLSRDISRFHCNVRRKVSFLSLNGAEGVEPRLPCMASIA